MQLVREKGSLTFEDLCADLPAARGPLTCYAPGSPDVAWWDGMSAEAIATLAQLRRAQLVRVEACDPALYGARPDAVTWVPADAAWRWTRGGPAWAPSVIVPVNARNPGDRRPE